MVGYGVDRKWHSGLPKKQDEGKFTRNEDGITCRGSTTLGNALILVMPTRMRQLKQPLKNLPHRVEQLRQTYPNAKVEVWAFDEHRLELKPIIRKVWSKRGHRPIAPVHHRYQWLYLYAFVCPHSGLTQWFILQGVTASLEGREGAG
jgi:hypothetical protein